VLVSDSGVWQIPPFWQSTRNKYGQAYESLSNTGSMVVVVDWRFAIDIGNIGMVVDDTNDDVWAVLSWLILAKDLFFFSQNGPEKPNWHKQ